MSFQDILLQFMWTDEFPDVKRSEIIYQRFGDRPIEVVEGGELGNVGGEASPTRQNRENQALNEAEHRKAGPKRIATTPQKRNQKMPTGITKPTTATMTEPSTPNTESEEAVTDINDYNLFTGIPPQLDNSLSPYMSIDI